MATIVSVHSFRGGTGKSNTTANLAAIAAGAGHRVGVIDGDIQSPGIHVLFGFAGEDVTASLNDFLWHDRPIEEVAHDVSGRLGHANASTTLDFYAQFLQAADERAADALGLLLGPTARQVVDDEG